MDFSLMTRHAKKSTVLGKMTNLELIKTTAIVESKNSAEEAKNYIFNTFIKPLIVTLGTFVDILIIAQCENPPTDDG